VTTRPKPNTLTAIETTALDLVARGHDYTSAATEMGRSRAAVCHAMDRARARMGATSTPHLLALAITAGYIDPDTAHGTAVTR
jgi:DNA-binding CsgD family transcriptional regulator